MFQKKTSRTRYNICMLNEIVPSPIHFVLHLLHHRHRGLLICLYKIMFSLLYLTLCQTFLLLKLYKLVAKININIKMSESTAFFVLKVVIDH